MEAIPPVPPPPLPQRKILLIRLTALGDILHVLPAISAIRAAMPNAFLGWLVEDSGAALVQGHPQLDAVHIVPRKAWHQNPFKALTGPMRDLVSELRREQYDVAIDFQGLSKSALWTKLSGAKQRIGFGGEEAREVSRFFYNASVHPRADQMHIVQRNLSLLRPLGIENPAVTFPVHLKPEVERFADELWGDLGDKYARVVMNPGAGWETKKWPAASYGRLAAELVRDAGARVVLAWGPGEERLVQTALEAGGEGGRRISKRGSGPIPTEPGIYPLPSTSFVELGAFIRRAHLFVGGDTGPTHFAAALGVPTLGLYGASDAKRNGPWGPQSRSIQLDEPPCIPCWKTYCAWDEPLACLTHIHVTRVRDLCFKMLEAYPGDSRLEVGM